MRRSALYLLLAAAALGDVPPGYYADAEGRTGAALRAALHQRIRAHRVIPYSGGATNTRIALEALDESPDNPAAVRLVYSGLDDLKANFGTATGWNREHLWPDSYGIDGAGPAYSDLFHLRACDATVNSSRGNLPFDHSRVSDGNYRAPAHIEAPGTSRDSDSWEPREEEKGDIARALFYLDVRYEGGPGEPDLQLTDDLASITSSGTRMGRLTTLIEWHLLDPPDAAERRRAEAIFAHWQANRNPFIDRPEWVTDLFGHPLRLSATLAAGAIELRWPTGLRRTRLEESADLVTWTPVSSQPSESAGEMILRLPAQTTRYWRLAIR